MLIRSILLEKNCTSTYVRGQFFQNKIERIKRVTDMFCFNDAPSFYTSNNIMKNIDG